MLSGRQYRLQFKKERGRELQSMANATVCNQDTLKKFEAKVGTRHVIVVSKEGCIEFSGWVQSFLPEEKLSVFDESGKLVTVDLAQIIPDRNFWYE
jgi:hypothetical protein